MQEFEDPQAQLEDRKYNVQKKKDNHWYTKRGLEQVSFQWDDYEVRFVLD
jgi:hypothetical protein